MDASAGTELLDRIVEYLIDPAVKVIFTLGFFIFLVGLVELLWSLKEGKPSQEGKNHMVWGLVGMLIMVSVYGIIAIIMNTLDLGDSATDISRIQDVDPGIDFSGQ